MAIFFHQESSQYTLKSKSRIKTWLKDVMSREGFTTGAVSVIFTDDERLRELNRDFLSRDYLTDIITFDYSQKGMISGDLFISIERVIENAAKYSVTVEEELLRIIVHGFLHMAGYKDASKIEKSRMRVKENQYLKMILPAS